jgi:hypothetical protein
LQNYVNYFYYQNFLRLFYIIFLFSLLIILINNKITKQDFFSFSLSLLPFLYDFSVLFCENLQKYSLSNAFFSFFLPFLSYPIITFFGIPPLIILHTLSFSHYFLSKKENGTFLSITILTISNFVKIITDFIKIITDFIKIITDFIRFFTDFILLKSVLIFTSTNQAVTSPKNLPSSPPFPSLKKGLIRKIEHFHSITSLSSPKSL